MRIVLEPGAYMPERAHDTDAGLDLRCKIDTTVPAHGSAVFATGVHMEFPHGWYGKIESKSGLNVRNDIVSCGGVIDQGYTGGIVVKLYNLGDTDYRFKAGDKIAQIVLMPYLAPTIELAAHLDDTERGADGFGSTGR